MKTIITALCLLLSFSAISGDIIKIEIGKDYKNYSKRELRERLWRLERAVWQLQQKVFELETSGTKKPLNTWICSLTAMGDKYSAAGPTKAVAKTRVINKCSKKRGDSFFCSKVTCEQ